MFRCRGQRPEYQHRSLRCGKSRPGSVLGSSFAGNVYGRGPGAMSSATEHLSKTSGGPPAMLALTSGMARSNTRRLMSAPTGTTVTSAAGPLTARRVSGLRRASFAAFVMLAVQFALGIYVNLYVTLPSADHGHGIGQAIANGPAGLTLHIVLGLLLILAALGFLVQAILARQLTLILPAVLGLLAMIGAAASGSAFTSSGGDGASMTMAALAAVGLLCYGTTLFLLPRPAAAGQGG